MIPFDFPHRAPLSAAGIGADRSRADTSSTRIALDARTRQLVIDGKAARIGARAFDILHMLVEHRDRVVLKSELLERVWPGLFVEENNLQVHVSALRKLLGRNAVTHRAGPRLPVHGHRRRRRRAGGARAALAVVDRPGVHRRAAVRDDGHRRRRARLRGRPRRRHRDRPVAVALAGGALARLGRPLRGTGRQCRGDRPRPRCLLPGRRQRAQQRRPRPRVRPAHRRPHRDATLGRAVRPAC